MGEGSVTVNVTHQTTKEKIAIPYEFGDTLEELIERWGKDCVLSNAVIGMKTQLRNRLYSITHAAEGEEPQAADASTAVAMLEGWKPTTVGTRVGADPLESLKKKFLALSKEERLRVLEDLRSGN